MITELQWRARAVIDGKVQEWFPAQVPGNVQKDYGEAMGFGDHSYGMNAEKFRVTEDYAWDYETEIPAEALCVPEGQALFLLNPVYCAIKYVRMIVLDNMIPGWDLHGLLLLYAVIALGIGSVIYKTQNNKFLYYV